MERRFYDVLVVARMLPPQRDGLSLIGTLREKGNASSRR